MELAEFLYGRHMPQAMPPSAARQEALLVAVHRRFAAIEAAQRRIGPGSTFFALPIMLLQARGRAAGPATGPAAGPAADPATQPPVPAAFFLT